MGAATRMMIATIRLGSHARKSLISWLTCGQPRKLAAATTKTRMSTQKVTDAPMVLGFIVLAFCP